MNLGMGNRKDITRRMTARIGVLLDTQLHGVTIKHPVILTVRPAWSGLITNIRVFDLQNNHLGAIPLRTPFAPMKETGTPRKLDLSLSCRRCTLRVRMDSGDNDEEQVEVQGRLVYRKKAPIYTTETFTELKFKFTDLITGEFTCRRMKLNINDLVAPPTNSDLAILSGGHYKINEFTPSEYNGSENVTSADMSFEDNTEMPATGNFSASLKTWSHSTRGPQSAKFVRQNSVTKVVRDPSAKSVVHRMSVADDSNAPAVTETNIESAEILREGFQHEGKYYMIRIVNEVDVTQVTMLQLRTNRVFVFLMTREHIDRTQNISKRLNQMLRILSANALVEPLFTGRQPLNVEEAAMIENPSMCCEKHCYVNLHPRGRGATLILVDPQNQPMLGTGFELLADENDHTPEASQASSPVFARAASGRFLPRGSPAVGSMRKMMSTRGMSMRGMSGRMMSSKSFRNNAVDEFLNGNMNPPAFPSEDEAEIEENIRSVSYKGRMLTHDLPTVQSVSTFAETGDGDTISKEASFSGDFNLSDAGGDGDADVGFEGAGGADEPQAEKKQQISATSSEDQDEDGFELAPLRTVTAKGSPAKPSSLKIKRPARPTAARVRSIAKHGMSAGLTLEQALEAAIKLQEGEDSPYSGFTLSAKGKVSFDEWESEKKEEQRKAERALTDFYLDGGDATPSEKEGASSSRESSGKPAHEYIEKGAEEEFLKSIVDVQWIEELGSIEVVEYVIMDLTSILMRSAVVRLVEQYSALPIFQNFVDDVIAQASKNALECLMDEIEETVEYAIEDVGEIVCEELFDEVVDDVTEERASKLNLMAFKQAVAAEAAEAKAKAAKSTKKPAGRPSARITEKPASVKSPPRPAEPEPVPEVKKDEIPVLRVADVPFSQPYRAAPDSPKSSTPVVYNVQKILSRTPADKRSSRPNFQRDSLVPALSSTVGKKRHTPAYLLGAQDYHPPEYLGRQSPLNSVYTGTFSRSDAFPGDWGESLDADSVSTRVSSLSLVEKRPGSRAQLLHFNTIGPLPVFNAGSDSALNIEISELTDMSQPSKRALGLRHALQDRDKDNEQGGQPLLSIQTVQEADQQPFRHSHTAPGALHHTHMHLTDNADDDVSIGSEHSGSSSPVFRTVQRRKLKLPMDEESAYSVGSASRAGARRSPNKRTMLDSSDYDVRGSSMSIADSLADSSFGDDSSLMSGVMSLRGSNGHMVQQARRDPLQVPPNGARALEKKRVVKESLSDFKHLGYVKDRPLVHSSHWRTKVFTYLASLKNADHLRKHVAMLTKATKVVLTPEEAVCALADTSGSVGEVADKLKSLDFYSELKLVCRSLHVRSMVCMIEGGERLFKSYEHDTFGDHGEFDDFSMVSDQEMRDKKNNPNAAIKRSLQFSRSVTAQTPSFLKQQSMSKTMPAGSPLTLLNMNSQSTASMQQLGSLEQFKSSTAPEYGQKIFIDDQTGGMFTAPANLQDQRDAQLEAEERGDTAGSPTLNALFHLDRERDELYPRSDDDDNSSMTSLSMSLGSISTKGAGSYYPIPAAVATANRPPAIIRTNTGASAASVNSAASSHSQSSAASHLVTQTSSKQLTPGMHSILALPRENSTKDVMAQSLSVQSKATFVPLTFANGGKRQSVAQIMGASAKVGKLSRSNTFKSEQGIDEEASPLPTTTSSAGAASPGADQRSQSINMFSSFGNRSLVGMRMDSQQQSPGGSFYGADAGGGSPPRKLTRLDTGSMADLLDPAVHKKLNRKSSVGAGSFRLAGRIDDLLVEHGETPLAIMCRRDFLKAQQDEVLLKSNKTYIRQPIEKKIGIVSVPLPLPDTI